MEGLSICSLATKQLHNALLNAKMIQRRLSYIHDNPRCEKLVQEPDNYPWSSAGAYVEGTKPPVPVDLLTFPAA